jgi:hypothetical protein
MALLISKNYPRNTRVNVLKRCHLSIERTSRLIINTFVGTRTRENAEQFLIELKNRMEPRRFQLFK